MQRQLPQENINQEGDVLHPPDGGVKAWLQAAMGWVVIFVTWGYVNSFGSFQAYFTSTLPQSPSAISWIGSLQAGLTFFVGAFSGRLLDAGLFLPVFITGACLQLLGIFFMSISNEYWQFLLSQGILAGIGGGIIFTPALALVATYFDKRRNIAMGIVSTGTSVGGVTYPLLVGQLLSRIGFSWTVRTLGFMNLGCLALVAALMRPRLPPRKSGPMLDWAAFCEYIYVFYVGGAFFFTWAVYYTFYYLASFGTEALGLDYRNASYLTMIVNGSSLPTRVAISYVADRVGTVKMIALAGLGVAIVAFCWLAVESVAGIYSFVTAYGLVSGAFQGLMPAGVASITTQLDTVGTRMGMCFSIISLAALTGPPIGGGLQSSHDGSFKEAQIWAGTSSLASGILLALVVLLKRHEV